MQVNLAKRWFTDEKKPAKAGFFVGLALLSVRVVRSFCVASG
jgi:hypothetical protein